MVLHRVLSVVVISLVNLQGYLQQTTPPSLNDIKCSQKKQLREGDCASAYRKIIYDGDSTLDINESSVERSSGSCVTRIDNPKFMNVPKAIIEDAFDQIEAKCNGRAGHATLPGFDGVRLFTRHHTRPSVGFYEDDLELNRAFCFDGPDDIIIVEQDCMEAYRLIPTNAEGRFVSIDHHVPMNAINSFLKKCIVSVCTSDGSKVMALKADMDILFGKLMQECNRRGGYILAKGALGKNGKIQLLVAGKQ